MNRFITRSRLFSRNVRFNSSIPPPPPPPPPPKSNIGTMVTYVFGLGALGVGIGYFGVPLYEANKEDITKTITNVNKVKLPPPVTRLSDLQRIADEEPQGEVTERAFFDISIDGSQSRRIIIGLYGTDCPKTVENFSKICIGDQIDPITKKPLHYKKTKFHRIIPGFMIQGGDFENGNGTGGRSIFETRKFADENFKYKHKGIGVVSMANSGKNTNSSQFFISVAPSEWLDGKHVVFGHVIHGHDILLEIENCGQRSGTPLKEVKIVACGILPKESLGSKTNPKEELDETGRAIDRLLK